MVIWYVSNLCEILGDSIENKSLQYLISHRRRFNRQRKKRLRSDWLEWSHMRIHSSIDRNWLILEKKRAFETRCVSLRIEVTNNTVLTGKRREDRMWDECIICSVLVSIPSDSSNCTFLCRNLLCSKTLLLHKNEGQQRKRPILARLYLRDSYMIIADMCCRLSLTCMSLLCFSKEHTSLCLPWKVRQDHKDVKQQFEARIP